MTPSTKNCRSEEHVIVATEKKPGHDSRPRLQAFASRIELPQILRWGGSIALASAAVVFMFQGLYSFSPITRHWFMLAICTLLGLMGLVTGAVIKEQKGARVFLGFAAASFPVLASQLGAMFFSIFGHPPAGMPQPLVFSAEDFTSAALAAGLTYGVAVPACHLTFKVLARSQAKLLTWVFTLANTCILLPFRESAWVGIVILLSAAFLSWIDGRILHRDFRLNNFEGRTSRLLLAGPLAVMLGRSLFYRMDPAFYGTMLVLLGCYLVFYWGRVSQTDAVKTLCRLSGNGGIIIGWMILLLSIFDSLSLNEGMLVYLAMIPVSIVMGAQGILTKGKTSRIFRTASAVIAFTGVALTHCIWASPAASLIGVVAAVALVSAGTLAAEKPVFTLGILAAVISLGNIFVQAIKVYNGYAWVALAAIGIGVVFTASLLDKKYSLPMMKGAPVWGRLKMK